MTARTALSRQTATHDDLMRSLLRRTQANLHLRISERAQHSPPYLAGGADSLEDACDPVEEAIAHAFAGEFIDRMYAFAWLVPELGLGGELEQKLSGLAMAMIDVLEDVERPRR